MPKLDFTKFKSLPDSLVEATPDDFMATDEQGRTLAYLLLEKFASKEQLKASDAEAFAQQQALLANPSLDPHQFNSVIDPQIKVSVTVKVEKNTKGVEGEKVLTEAGGFANTMDLSLRLAMSERANTYGERLPVFELVRNLLERPINIPEAYFNRVYATMIREVRAITTPQKRLELIGTYASLLTGLDVLEILVGKHDIYHAHVQAYIKESLKLASGDSLFGFLPWQFLPLRIFFTLQLLVDLQLGFISDKELEDYQQTVQCKDIAATRSYIIEQLKQELKRSLQTYKISRYGYYIGNGPSNLAKIDMAPFLRSLTQGVVNSIKALPFGDSVIIYLAWDGEWVKDKGRRRWEGSHAIYLQIYKVEESWDLLIHNLGAGSEKHLYIEDAASKITSIHPYGLKRLSKEAWQNEESVGFKYLFAMLQALYPLSPKSIASPVYYDVKGILTGPNTMHLSPDAYAALPEQRTGNCVYENNTAARYIHFKPQLYEWLLRKESEMSGHYARDTVSKCNPVLLTVLNDNSCDTIPREAISLKAEFLSNPVTAFQNAYKDRYAFMGSVSKAWQSAPMRMENYYVELDLIQRNGKDAEGDSTTLRPIKVDELLRDGGTRWIVGEFGSGKSTFLQHIAHEWARNTNPSSSAYTYIILVPLRMLGSIKIEGASIQEKVISCLGKIYFDLWYNEELRSAFAEAIFGLESKEILWLLDGWNEVDSENTELKEIFDFIRGQKNVFISTRPIALSTEDANRPHIKVLGLSDDKVSEWMDIQIRETEFALEEDREEIFKQKAQLLEHLRNNEKIWELVHYPIILKIICMALVQNHLTTEFNSIAAIYKVMFDMFAARHGGGVEDDKIAEYWGTLESMLGKLAFRILENGNRQIKVEELAGAVAELTMSDYSRHWANEIMQCGLLTPAVPVTDPKRLLPVFFMHDSFYEYLGSKGLARVFRDKQRGFIKFFKKSKYEARYQVAWRFISGMFDDVALADAWFQLWFTYPRRVHFTHVDTNLAEKIADLVMESPVAVNLALCTTLLDYINTHWASKMAELPRGLIKLIKAVRLWSAEDAKKWVEQILNTLNDVNKALPYSLNNRDLPEGVLEEFYGKINNIAKLLKDAQSINPELLKAFSESINHDDLKLREHRGDHDWLYEKVGAIPKTDFLKHRMRFLNAIVHIKVNLITEAVLAQFEDALLWCSYMPDKPGEKDYGKDLLRLVIRAIFDNKLNIPKINEYLFDFIRGYGRDEELNVTLKLMIDALAVQISKDPTILLRLTEFLKTEEEPALIEHILSVLSRNQYSDKSYLENLYTLLENDSKQRSLIRTHAVKALNACMEYAPLLTPEIKAQILKAFPLTSTTVTEESDIDMTLSEPELLAEVSDYFEKLTTPTTYKRLSSVAQKTLHGQAQQNKKFFNHRVNTLLQLPVLSDGSLDTLCQYFGEHLDESNSKMLLDKAHNNIFADVMIYANIKQSYLISVIEYIDFENEHQCTVTFKNKPPMKFNTAQEYNFWLGFYPEDDLALANFLSAGMSQDDSGSELNLFSMTMYAGVKRKPAPNPSASTATGLAPEPPAKRSRLPAPESNVNAHTVNVHGHVYKVNPNYWYEVYDVTPILDTCLMAKDFKDIQVNAMAAVDNMMGNSLADRLNSERENYKGARITLMPCNLGNNHWVGLLLEFNNENQCIRAEYLDSQSGDVPRVFVEQLKTFYPGCDFVIPADNILRQSDGVSCGPYSIENLLLRVTRTPATPDMLDRESIRAKQLHILAHADELPGVNPKFANLYKASYQKLSRDQFKDFPSFTRADSGVSTPQAAFAFGASLASLPTSQIDTSMVIE